MSPIRNGLHSLNLLGKFKFCIVLVIAFHLKIKKKRNFLSSFILDEAKMKHVLDMHWTPITKFCTPCQVKFDIVAKFETLDEDQRYLIKRANLNSVIKPEWKNSGKGRNTQDLVSKYYAQLTREQLDGIYQLFR